MWQHLRQHVMPGRAIHWPIPFTEGEEEEEEINSPKAAASLPPPSFSSLPPSHSRTREIPVCQECVIAVRREGTVLL